MNKYCNLIISGPKLVKFSTQTVWWVQGAKKEERDSYSFMYISTAPVWELSGETDNSEGL